MGLFVRLLDRFYISLFSALEQTHCAFVACDSPVSVVSNRQPTGGDRYPRRRGGGRGVGVGGELCLMLHCQHQNNISIKMGSSVRHCNV